jgi:DNA-binding NarL/FixJ family response regulator
LFVDAAETGDATGDLVTAVDALHALARTGRPRDALARIVMLAEHVEGELTVTRVRHVQGLVGRDAPTLAEVSHGFEALGALLLAAEAAADAAVAAHRRGRPRDAAAAEHRARALAARCAGAATPALRTVTSRARLTPSELQTATLAASGHTNREIAEQLFLSVRTVENRLQRVYEKLGLRSRQELGPALHDHP